MVLPGTKQFMAVNNFKLAEPIKVCREQFCMGREMDKLRRDHKEFLDCWDLSENADTSRQKFNMEVYQDW